jgi:RNA polymerase sigma-70 factor (ECF subfamily)
MDRSHSGHESDVALAQVTPPPERLPGTAFDFTQVYEQYFDFVWRTVRRLGVRERSVDDAVQDVFIVVHRKLVEFEGRSSIKSWIFGISRRVARDHRRRVDRKERDEALPEGLADPQSKTPMENAARNEAVRVLHGLLDELDDEKREVFVLAELEQMTVPEIADAITVNVNTVYSRLRAARKAFDRAVERYHARERRGR